MSHKLTKLFDGDDSLFKDLLKNSKNYGEYGCGLSTEWVLNNTNANILSVDSSKEWIDKISSKNVEYKKRLKLQHIDLGKVENWGRPVGYEKSYNFINYFNWIWTQDILPDTVLIDGRFRVCCFLTSIKYANENTKIIFDDYNNRPYYHVVEKFVKKEQTCGRQALFIVKNKNDINIDLLNIEINNFHYVMD
mgnify:FL=1